MQNSMFCSQKDLVSKFCDDEHFDKSLQELRNLRSQLHNAAEYCESTFLQAKEKKEDARNEVMSTKTIDKDVFRKEDDMPLFVYASSHKAALSKGENNSALLLPVQEGLSILSKSPNPSFYFQEKRKIVRARRSLHGRDILSLIRRTRRTP
ncbi:hypothetical protein TIFTF001_019712 [Ficus carica]|uniref:Uncharacterized protein n=1 Tax=Ficus carica TaxID=3494 RepID=A0AA88AET5_FICCA|nr:hypothetical protein TIFTF001_019712 [Ficus carica]